MEKKQDKPELSIFPFEGIMSEVTKLQGHKPALIILYSGPEDILFLNNNLSFNSPAMDLFMKHLTIEVLKAKGVDLKIINNIQNNDTKNTKENDSEEGSSSGQANGASKA